MSNFAVCVWIASVLLDTTGRLAFKSAAVVSGNTSGGLDRWKRMLRAPSLWTGIICFCGEFIAWLALLSLIPLSQAILIGSMNIVAVVVAGRLFFGERLDKTRVIAVSLIVVGVALAGASA